MSEIEGFFKVVQPRSGSYAMLLSHAFMIGLVMFWVAPGLTLDRGFFTRTLSFLQLSDVVCQFFASVCFVLFLL